MLERVTPIKTYFNFNLLNSFYLVKTCQSDLKKSPVQHPNDKAYGQLMHHYLDNRKLFILIALDLSQR